jgi:hypothetical protein
MYQSWMTGWDIWEMSQLLRSQKKVSRRKLRLLTGACCRRFWGAFQDDCFRRAVNAIEQHADGRAASATLAAVWDELEQINRDGPEVVANRPRLTARAVGLGWDLLLAPRTSTDQLILLMHSAACTAALAAWEALGPAQAESSAVEICREVCDSLRCVFGNPFRPSAIGRAWMTWNSGVVERIARESYEEREMPRGTLDSTRLAVLADALEEAGCADEAILGHLRGPTAHVRGCLVVDSLLGKA